MFTNDNLIQLLQNGSSVEDKAFKLAMRFVSGRNTMMKTFKMHPNKLAASAYSEPEKEQIEKIYKALTPYFDEKHFQNAKSRNNGSARSANKRSNAKSRNNWRAESANKRSNAKSRNNWRAESAAERAKRVSNKFDRNRLRFQEFDKNRLIRLYKMERPFVFLSDPPIVEMSNLMHNNVQILDNEFKPIKVNKVTNPKNFVYYPSQFIYNGIPDTIYFVHKDALKTQNYQYGLTQHRFNPEMKIIKGPVDHIVQYIERKQQGPFYRIRKGIRSITPKLGRVRVNPNSNHA